MKLVFVVAAVLGMLLQTSPAAAQATIVGVWIPGTDESAAIAINNSGLVLVRGRVDQEPWQSRLREPDGTLIAPLPPPGFHSGFFNGINDVGDAVATISTGTLSTVAVRSADGTWSLPMQHTRAVPLAINNDGALAGYLNPLGGPARAFLYEPGGDVTVIPVGVPRDASGLDTTPGINNQGLVFGADLVGPNRFHAYRYSRTDGLVMLSTPTGQNSDAAGANHRGEIVGATLLSGSVVPVKWDSDGELHVLKGLSSGLMWANGINYEGDVVGSGFLAGPRAVLWSDELGALDLNDLLSPADRVHWELRIAYQINDHRQIVGSGMFDPDGPSGPAPRTIRGFLMTVPEPGLSGVLVFTMLLCRTPKSGRP